MIRIQDEKIQDFETTHMETLRKVSAECTLLLKEDGTLPLSEAGTLALYGSGARNTIKGGTGSGDVNVRHFATIEEGLENAGFTITSKKWLDSYEKVKADAHQAFVEQVRREAKELGINPVMYGMGKPMPEPEYELPMEDDADAAIYVLSRSSGEGADRSRVSGDIELSVTEIRDIKKLNQKYDKFILMLNVGGMVNLQQVAEVKNILLLSQLGTKTGDVAADLLLGKSYPSGKLAMTWAQIKDYSTTEGFGDMDDTCYKEGIYVGYRYFDSVGKTPAYPFGYGLSYTGFSLETKKFEADENQVKVTVAVTNTGKHAGKEVVQVYASAPLGKLDKPYQELKGFVKTEEIAPGETSEVVVRFQTTDMASYDTDSASYVMEAGSYIIRVGNSSRDTNVCGIVALNETVVTEKVKNICGGWNFMDFKPEQSRDDIETDQISTISVCGKKITAKAVKYKEVPVELTNNGRCTWQQVVSKEKSLEEFVGGLTEDEMAYLCNGTFDENAGPGSQVGAAAVSVAGAAGETTFKLKELGTPTITMADGPAGLRLCTKYKIADGKVKGQDSALANFMDFMEPEQLAMMASMAPKPTQEELDAPMNYVYCIAIPIGTALAQSWSTEVCETCGDIVGKEMEMFGVNLWLAPAMNIQRSPLCGRDFEYYSEDPFVSGKMAAAITKAVQAHKGCGTTIKHFVCNNQETNRMVSNSIVSERALREIYLKGFEICVKESQPHTIMSSYNLVNGEHACNSKDLLTCVLRDEWGYEGLVMTDWYAANHMMVAASERKNKHDVAIPSGCVKAGNDLVMPGTTDEKNQILTALKEEQGEYPITKAELQVTAKRVLSLILNLS